jgi:5,10-methylenetetrahydromethanopterin reductase
VELGLAVGVDDSSLDDIILAAKTAEASGYSSIWCSNSRFMWDPFQLACLVAAETKAVKVGIFVADPFSVHPYITARSAATLQRITRGRAVLGIGAGGTGFTALGVTRRRPVSAVVAAVSEIRELLAGGKVRRDSLEYFQLSACVTGAVPIVIAARGQNMLRAGGAIADGVMVSHHVNEASLAQALAFVRENNERAVPRPRIYLRVDVCLCESTAIAVDLLRPSVALSLGNSWSDRDLADRLGLTPEDRSLLGELYRHSLTFGNEAEALSSRIRPVLVESLCWLGSLTDIARRFDAVAGQEITEVVIVPHLASGHSLSGDVEIFSSLRQST